MALATEVRIEETAARPSSDDGPRRFPLLAGCAFLSFAFVAWFGDLVFPLPPSLRRYVVHGDFSNQFYPFQHFAAEEWRQGRIPLWNPYAYAGHPFQADPQSAVFYPPGFLVNVLLGRDGLTYLAMEWRAAMSYVLAAIFMYLFVERVGKSHGAGLIAALAFAGGGFLTSYPMQQLPVLEAAIWLPFCLYAFERSVERRGCSTIWAAVAGLVLGVSFLAGHTQTTMFAGYIAAAYFVFRCVQTRQPPARAALSATVAALAMLALSLPQLLPTWEFTQLSNRAPLSYQEAGGGYELRDLTELLNPKGLFQRGYFVGIAPLVLLLAAWRRPSGRVWFWSAVGLVGVLLALGKYGPLYPLAYHVLPAYSLFKDQERAAYLWSFSAAVLAGVGWTALICSGARNRRAEGCDDGTPVHARHALSVGAACAAMGLGLFAAAYFRLQPVPVDNPASDVAPVPAFVAAVAVCGGMIALRFAVVRRGAHYAAALAAALVLVGGPLYGANAGNNRSASPPPVRAGALDALAYASRQPGLFRVAELQDLLPGNLGVIEHVSFPTGDSPIYLRTVRTLLETHLQYRLSQLFNVRYLIGTSDDGGPGVKLVATYGDLRVFERQYSLPRAWAVRDVRVAASDDQDLDMTLHVPEPGATAVVRQPLALPIQGPSLPRDQHETWTSYQPTDRELDVMVTDDALLVVSEPWYPGWEATLDGRPAPIIQTDYAFQGIEIPAGTHHVVFRFRPVALYRGAMLGVVALLVAIAMVTADQVLRRRSPR